MPRRSAVKSRPIEASSALRWKFHAPPLSTPGLPRVQLVERMERFIGRQRTRGAALVLDGPAGYGKTTLLAQWAQETSLQVAWYHLDGSDDDAVVFVRRVLSALRHVFPYANWRTLDVLRGIRNGILSPADLGRIKNMLGDDIRRIVTEPTALALTNIDALHHKGQAHSILSALLGDMPEHLRLVLESRAHLQLSISSLVQDGRLEMIGVDALSLSHDETTRLLGLLGVEASAEEIETLYRVSNGWITGLVLATDPSGREALATGEYTEGSLGAYLTQQVIEALPAGQREFARQSAIFETMTPARCGALLGITDARDRLGQLARQTSFLKQFGDELGGPRYQFHPLLRHVLLLQLKAESNGVERRRALHAKAADILEDEEALDEAIRHHAHARQYERISALIETQRGYLLRNGRGATLAKWVAMLPAPIRSRRPEMQLLLAELYRHAGKADQAWQALRRASAAISLPTEGEQSPLAARAFTLRAMLRFGRGKITSARADAERALSCAPEDDDELHIQAGLCLVACFSLLGNRTQALECLDAVRLRAARLRDLWALARCWYLRSKIETRGVRFAAAAQAANTALRFAQEANDAVGALNSRINLGSIRAAQGQFEIANEQLESASEQARLAGYSIGRAYILANQADLDLMRGKYANATRNYRRALHLANELDDAYLRECAQAGMGFALTMDGNPNGAVNWLKTMVSPEIETSAEPQHTYPLLAFGLASLRQRQHDQAHSIFTQVYDYAVAHEQPGAAISAKILLSATLLAMGRGRDALAMCQSALEQVEIEDTIPAIAPSLRYVREVVPLLESMDDPRAIDLLIQLTADDEQRVASIDALQETLRTGADDHSIRVFLFGQPRVLVGSEVASHWRLPAAREMLCYLLVQGEPVRKETLIADIWPDKTEQIANINFRQAVFQLNRVLERKTMVKHHGRWRLALTCQVDMHDFERLVTAGEQLARTGQAREAVVAFRQALSYYTGRFMEDTENTWATLRGEQLYLRRLACLEAVAGLEEQLGRWEDAARHYFELLEDETPHEAAHRGLMRYFAMRQEFAGVHSQYQRCIARLGPEVPPSPETQQLYRSIMADAQTLAVEESRVQR